MAKQAKWLKLELLQKTLNQTKKKYLALCVSVGTDNFSYSENNDAMLALFQSIIAAQAACANDLIKKRNQLTQHGQSEAASEIIQEKIKCLDKKINQLQAPIAIKLLVCGSLQAYNHIKQGESLEKVQDDWHKKGMDWANDVVARWQRRLIQAGVCEQANIKVQCDFIEWQALKVEAKAEQHEFQQYYDYLYEAYVAPKTKKQKAFQQAVNQKGNAYIYRQLGVDPTALQLNESLLPEHENNLCYIIEETVMFYTMLARGIGFEEMMQAEVMTAAPLFFCYPKEEEKALALAKELLTIKLAENNITPMFDVLWTPIPLGKVKINEAKQRILGISDPAQQATILPQQVGLIRNLLRLDEIDQLDVQEKGVVFNIKKIVDNSLYVERDDIKKIQFNLHTTNKTQIVHMHGMGGVGKTTIIKAYLEQVKDRYALRAYFDMANQPYSSAVLLSLVQLAVALGYQEQDGYAENFSDAEKQSAVQYLKEWLTNHRDWLLVFDNVSQFEKIKEFIPTVGGHVLITSRQVELDVASEYEYTEIEVKPMAASKSMELLTSFLPDNSEEELTLLAKVLGHLPLALIQAAAHIRETKVTIKKYIEAFKSEGKGLKALLKSGYFQDDGITDSHETTWATWSLTLIAVKKNQPILLKLLDACAYLSSDVIPIAWVKSWLRLNYIDQNKDQFSQAVQKEVQELWEQLKKEALNYSLIDIVDDQFFSVHAVFQTVLRCQFEMKNKRKIKASFYLPILNALNDVFFLSFVDSYMQHNPFALKYHIRMPGAEAGKLVANYELILDHLSEKNYSSNEFLLEFSYAYYSCARLLKMKNQSIDKAEKYCKSARKLFKNLGHQEYILLAEDLLTDLYYRQEKWLFLQVHTAKLAPKLLERARLLPNHDNVSSYINTLSKYALAFAKTGGSLATALAIIAVARGIAIQLYGEHNEVLINVYLNAVGICLQYQDLPVEEARQRLMQAKEYVDQALSVAKRRYGLMSPSYISLLPMLAHVHLCSGEFEKVKDVYERYVKKRRAIGLPDNDFLLIRVYAELGRYYAGFYASRLKGRGLINIIFVSIQENEEQKRENFKKAKEYFSISQRALSQHPEFKMEKMAVRIDVAYAHLQLGELKDAEAAYLKLLLEIVSPHLTLSAQLGRIFKMPESKIMLLRVLSGLIRTYRDQAVNVGRLFYYLDLLQVAYSALPENDELHPTRVQSDILQNIGARESEILRYSNQEPEFLLSPMQYPGLPQYSARYPENFPQSSVREMFLILRFYILHKENFSSCYPTYEHLKEIVAPEERKTLSTRRRFCLELGLNPFFADENTLYEKVVETTNTNRLDHFKFTLGIKLRDRGTHQKYIPSINSIDANKKTILHHVVINKRKRMAYLLVMIGADVLIKDSENRSPIDIAERTQQKAMLAILLMGEFRQYCHRYQVDSASVAQGISKAREYGDVHAITVFSRHNAMLSS